MRLRGLFWFCLVRERLERLGRGRMRRAATKMTWRSENFFSSSRVKLGADVSVVSCGTGEVSVEREEKGKGRREENWLNYRCWTL